MTAANNFVVHHDDTESSKNVVGPPPKAFTPHLDTNALALWQEFIDNKKYSVGNVFGHTQMGKTYTLFEFARHALLRGFSTIISCDNRTDQLEQFSSRFRIYFAVHDEVVILCVSEPRFGKKLAEAMKKTRKVIIFCLNNESQIRKISEQMVILKALKKVVLRRLCLIHDEGDVVTKDQDVAHSSPDQPKAHSAWIEFIHWIKEETTITLKRAFVTATPENIVYKYPTQLLINLEPGTGYIGYNKIKMVPIVPDAAYIRQTLKEEYDRITSGVLLFCTERRVDDGHNELFRSIIELVDGVVNTYNGTGITVRVEHPGFEERIAGHASDKDIRYKIKSTKTGVFTLTGYPISEFYEVCRQLGCMKIVTIGMDLMARGISFVSSSSAKDTIAAVSMIYAPGKNQHAVGLAQAIGRITGRARPDVERRLFAPREVIDNYLKYMKNQDAYLEDIKETRNSAVSMIKIEHKFRLSCSLDRVKLRLRPRYVKLCAKMDYMEHNEQIVAAPPFKTRSISDYMDEWLQNPNSEGSKILDSFDERDSCLDVSKFKASEAEFVEKYAFAPTKIWFYTDEKTREQIKLTEEAKEHLKNK